MIRESEQINIHDLVLEMPVKENKFDQLSLIDERHWRWLEAKLKQPFIGNEENHAVLDIAANLKVLFPKKFSQLPEINLDMKKVDFGLFANPRTFMILFSGLTFLSSSREKNLKLLEKIKQCREQGQWPEYFKLTSICKLLEPSYTPEPLSDIEIAGVDEDLSGTSLFFEVFEDARVGGSNLIEVIREYIDSHGSSEVTSEVQNLNTWADYKRDLFKKYWPDDIFDNVYEMQEFTELIRQCATIEADEVLVSEKGIELVFKHSLEEDVVPPLPQTRRF